MKLLFAAATALSLVLTSVLGLNSAPKPTVTSIRAFEEPLVAIGGDKSANQDSALIAALQTFEQRKTYDDVSAITGYLDANAQSPWKFSLLANLGIVYKKTGHFSRAVDTWEQAWALGKGEKSVQAQALANRVAAELASLLSSLGRSERLAPLIAETKGRTIYGSAHALLKTANENLWLMKNQPGKSFKCGPFALNSIRTFAKMKNPSDQLIHKAQSSTKGFSLTQVRDLSNALKMNYQMAKRQTGADFITPAVTHWKSGHFAALLKRQGDYYLIKDPTFNQEILVTAQALEDETSGYFLVPPGQLPSGWQTVTDTEGNTVWGRGIAMQKQADATKNSDKRTNPCPPPPPGMAAYNVLAMLVSLSIQDTPVGYKPPVGPDVHFTIVYNQLEANQPATFSFFNFGPSWNCEWLAYVTKPTSVGGTAYVNTRGGGRETYDTSTYVATGSTYPGYVGYYGYELQSQAALWVATSGSFERRLPDGSKEVFSQVGVSGSGGTLYLTSIIDPQGNAVTLGYDSSYYTSTGNLRLTTVTDALGLATTLAYGLSGDPLKVTQITDPCGRYATFNYTSYSGTYQLTSIVDVVGITSTFGYGTGSAITSMETPYGTTGFSSSSSNIYDGAPQTDDLTVTEPDGGQIKVESDLYLGSPTPYSNPYPYGSFDPGTARPSGYGLSLWDDELQYQNTFYWDKKAMHDAAGDYTKAHIYHWLLESDDTSTSGVLQCEKPALESRIWYQYYAQPEPWMVGASSKPLIVARVVDGSGTTQAWQYQYNFTVNPGVVTAMIDPTGRKTNYTYASNGIDLTGVTQNVAGSGTDTIFAATYNSQHEPLTQTDMAGETTTYTYNSQGQVLTVTPPTRSGLSAETTTYGYTGNYLTSITGPMTGATKTLTYDTLGGNTVNRIKTVADAESYTLTYTYDNLDRVTQILYPDSSTETFSYVNTSANAYGVTNAVDLDVHFSTDRVGQTTFMAYDSVRHLTTKTDPLTDMTTYTWCTCGSMASMTDANTHTTYFNRDVESRLTSKVYPGETQPPTLPDYTYDLVGRVATYTNKRGDKATYTYNLDNTISGVTYLLASGGTTASTPNVSYGYDTYYNRVTSVGGVSLTYKAAGSLGAGKPATITNTMTGGSAAIAYTYDEWGRVVGRNIDSADNETTTFDSLGRLSSIVNALCPSSTSFAYTYFDNSHPTNRIGTIAYPNGQSAVYDYFGNTGDERLEEIKNETPASAVLSQQDYTYSADGKIATWQQQTDSSTPTLWTEGYDAGDRLTSAVLTNTAITSPAVRSDSYGYDAVGNATTFNVSGVSRSPSYNSLNQLTGSTPSGNRTVGFTGLLNGAATVTVNGSSATVNSGHYFSGTASLTPGTTATVPIVATDSSGNVRTNNYQTIVPTEPTYSPTYDNDGNELTSGAGQTYTWDAKNELASITYTGGASTLFTYDALGHRIKIVEKNSGGTVTSTKQLVWNGTTIAEERDVSNAVTKKFFALGEQIGSSSYYYAKDHLGSVREMTDSTGAIQARYDYDPYGRTTLVSGTNLSDFQYAGYYVHQPSGLNLTWFRAYDPNTARWLSRDLLGEGIGPNLYAYVGNNPVDWFDPFGLCPTAIKRATGVRPLTPEEEANEKLEGDIVGGAFVAFLAAPVYAEAAAANFAWQAAGVADIGGIGAAGGTGVSQAEMDAAIDAIDENIAPDEWNFPPGE